jgi:hypothetical protein
LNLAKRILPENIEEAQKVSKDEMLMIYRDLFRASGIWQYPGLQR